jgi:N-acetylmuramoyl-L-alanine amidase CwlA
MSYENPKAMNSSTERSKIDRIVLHHNATTNPEVAMDTWTVANGKNTSAHYEITDTQIIGCVPEDFTAWHSGDWNANLRSIGLEHLNSSGAPDWTVSDATMQMSAKLIADICKRYGLPIDATTIQPHKNFSATACPGGLDVSRLIKMAQEVASGGQAPTPEQPKQEEEIMTDGIFKIADEHAGYKKGDYVYWSSATGFKYLPDAANITLLKTFNPKIVEMTSGAKGPWVARAAQINGTNYGKR